MNDNYPPGISADDIDRQFGGEEEVEDTNTNDDDSDE